MPGRLLLRPGLARTGAGGEALDVFWPRVSPGQAVFCFVFCLGKIQGLPPKKKQLTKKKKQHQKTTGNNLRIFSQAMRWVWVKIQPPGYGPQVLVHVSTRIPCWVHTFDPTVRCWSPWKPLIFSFGFPLKENSKQNRDLPPCCPLGFPVNPGKRRDFPQKEEATQQRWGREVLGGGEVSGGCVVTFNTLNWCFRAPNVKLTHRCQRFFRCLFLKLAQEIYLRC